LSCADTASITVDANGIITVTRLTNDKLWKLNGVSYVNDGQTLTIDPGTTIITGRTKTYNDPAYGLQTIAGVLVVAKGGKLIANGTATQPIVFTSPSRSEEHTSELQSRENLVCRLLLEKKKTEE